MSFLNASATTEKDHEDFKSSLVDDVFGKDTKGKVPMEKVVMLIWQFRDDPNVVHFMAQFVAKFASISNVFAGIEFYLPQLAHMIIHLEADWDDAILERFALIIAQQSLHFALQLNWILAGAIEDYEPELPNGMPNPKYNPLYYSRCILLLQNIERIVVYGKPRSVELQKLYDSGKITKQEYEILELHDRRYNAHEIQERELKNKITYGGTLLYKRQVRGGCLKPKRWNSHYFCIQSTMLNCFDTKGGKLLRSMPLEDATVEEIKGGKYPHMLLCENRGFHFVMRCSSAQDQQAWMTNLQQAGKAHDLFSQDKKKKDQAPSSSLDLTTSQQARFDFFRNERKFVLGLTQLAETLRFVEPQERKALAPTLVQELELPDGVYVPLCNSTHIWRRIDKALPNHVKVFNTKERCPVILNFVSKRGEPITTSKNNQIKNVNLDVAEYLHLKFDILEDDPHKVQMDAITEEVPEETEVTVDQKNGDELQGSTHASIWQDKSAGEKAGEGTPVNGSGGGTGDTSQASRHTSEKGNRQVQVFLRDNLIRFPNKLANRVAARNRHRGSTHLDKAKTPIEPIPILGDDKKKHGVGAAADSDNDDDLSVVSVERGSVMTNKSFILGRLKDDRDIDMESVQRATDVVSGGTRWAEKTKKMLEESVPEEESGVAEITSLMSKSNDDLRQEVFVMQMIHYYKSVFAKANIPLWLKTYRILSTSSSTGLIEVLTDATSIHGLKTSDTFPQEGGLRAYFENVYGDPAGKSFQAAQRNFMKSLAAYSLVGYLLGLKDRHNGNIMIDNLGHLIFIDFGFAMGMAPGHEFSFERAPFKMTKEYAEVLGGVDSECFKEFRALFVRGFMEARKNSLIALGMVEIMMYKSNYPCFTGSRYGNGIALRRFERRLMLGLPDEKAQYRANKLIDRSLQHFGTYAYDAFQQYSNGYVI